MLDEKLIDEPARLAALRRYEVLDTPPEAPFERITGLVRAVLGVPISTLSLIDADRQSYKSCVGIDNSDMPREFSFCTHTIQSREAMHVPDTLEDPRFQQYPSVIEPPFIRSYLGAPLCSPDGYNLGSLCALDVQPRHFSDSQIEVLKSFAALAVDELELRRIAQTDSLTGTATRRAFLLELEKAIARFVRYEHAAALLTLDVDHFKRINDTYGHATGDTVLRAITKALQSILRKEDVIGRLGGEEFGVLLSAADQGEAVQVAEKLRNAIKKISFDLAPSLTVTASFGIAALDAHQLSPELWLANSDEALYKAKREGRDRCCVGELKSQLAVDEASAPSA